MGGKKCKINIEKIEKKSVKWVTFSKRRNGLYRKATELCRLSPATQIAILATPISSHSHASFYSFGHPSVDHVVSSLLHDQSPFLSTNLDNNNRSGLGFWWEDESFDTSENVEELRDAADAVTRMMNNVRLRLDAVKSNQRDKDLVIHHEEEDLQHINYEDTHQTPEFGGASGSGSLFENDKDNLELKNYKDTNQTPSRSLFENDKDNLELISYEDTNQTPKYGGASGSGSLFENNDEDNLQLISYPTTSNNEETNDQIPELGGSMLEFGDDNLDIDDLLTNFNNHEHFI